MLALLAAPGRASADPCTFSYPVGQAEDGPAPLGNFHPVGGGNLPNFGVHLGADYWSGPGCTDLGQTVYAVADGEVVEIVDNLGSYLDVVVLRHDDPVLGATYSMYGHMDREPGLSEGQMISRRDEVGSIGDVLQYFSPCHLHFELLNEAAYEQGPFCSGCQNAGFHVSPGYDQNKGVVMGESEAGDPYIEVQDAIDNNRWYYTDEFIDARLDATCEVECGDGVCSGGEDDNSCPVDCPCPALPPEGGVLDDSGLCFEESGDPQWWTYEQGIGYADTVLWTTTTDSQQVDNTGTWTINLSESGEYALSVHIPEGLGLSKQAAYVVTHALDDETVVVDQSVGGWIDLGAFDFDTLGSIRLDDNTGEPWSEQIPLYYDAISLERLDGGTGEESGDGGESGGEQGDSGGGESTGNGGEGGSDGDGLDEGGTAGSGGPGLRPGASGCSCRAADPRAAPPALALLLLLGAARIRRRR